MDRIKKKKTIQVPGVFMPTVKVGAAIHPDEILGTASVPTVLEVHSLDNGKALVDEGTFVSSHTPMIEYKKGFKKEIIGSTHEGIVHISKKTLSLVADDVEEDVRSNTWGRLLSVSEHHYIVEVSYLRMPIFISRGNFVEAPIIGLLQKGAMIAPHHITDEVRDKVVLLPGAVSKETYAEIVARGAVGVLAPSIDWADYLSVFSQSNANIGILHGFGMFPLWRWYYHLLSKLENVIVEVDFENSYLFVPISDILMG
ncbi:hypothetical protein COZ14_03420, partial [Candidatus Dojkabacteria bacterium CG_4_10_14_3_um_filter_Dojkabacteria_WS6_41_9]